MPALRSIQRKWRKSDHFYQREASRRLNTHEPTTWQYRMTCNFRAARATEIRAASGRLCRTHRSAFLAVFKSKTATVGIDFQAFPRIRNADTSASKSSTGCLSPAIRQAATHRGDSGHSRRMEIAPIASIPPKIEAGSIVVSRRSGRTSAYPIRPDAKLEVVEVLAICGTSALKRDWYHQQSEAPMMRRKVLREPERSAFSTKSLPIFKAPL